jgi:hypothetical protein
MSPAHSPRDVGDIHVEQAARAGVVPSIVDTGAERLTALLHNPRPRDVPLPEPVDVAVVNGRVAEEWEQDEIRAARERARREEWRT